MRTVTRARWPLLLPMIALVGIAVLSAALLLRPRDAADLFVGGARPAPDLVLAAPLGGGLAWAGPDAPEGARLVNFWASWCGPCRVEHPLLMQLAAEGIDIDGVLYKDDPARGAQVLELTGNPYARIGLDPDGRAGLAFGIIGVPETVVIDADGFVTHIHRGPLDPDSLQTLRSLLDAPDHATGAAPAGRTAATQAPERLTKRRPQ